MQYDFIGLEEAAITGSINSTFIIKGQVKKDKYNIKILFNNKEVDFENIYKDDIHRFYIKISIPKEIKIIEAYVVVEDQEYLIFNAKTNEYKRFISGVSRKIKDKIDIKYALREISKEFKFVWKEYHLLVPPVLIPKRMKDLKARINGRKKMFNDPQNPLDYRKWLKNNEREIIIDTLDYNPKISIITTINNTAENRLKECIESVLKQTYKNWELCLIDNNSTKKSTKDLLKEYENKDSRIIVKHRKEKSNKSKAYNDGLKLSKGEFITLINVDDVLNKNALYYMVMKLNEDKKLDLIYSDEDKLDDTGRRCRPHFKPDYSPDTLLSFNYISHLTLIRKTIIDKVGGFDTSLEGSEDYDLILKITEKTNKIYHIPEVLYHSRTNNNLNNTEKEVLEKTLKRRNINGKVIIDEKSNLYIIKYILKKEPLVSIIIPTRDYADITRTCLESIYEKTTYKNFEIVLANNDSKEEETIELFEEFKNKYNNFRVVDINIDFNYSRINNLAVKEAKGEIIVLLNNDTEIISPEWLTDMVSYAAQDHIGAVGAKLLYPDMLVQHGGVILGLGGVASHAYIGAHKSEKGLYGRLRVPYNYSANTAACLAVKKSLYNKVGGLEENLTVAYNDIDLCIKILEKGYYNVFLPQVELIHYESKTRGLETTAKKYKRFLKEVKFMNNKWKEKVKIDKYYNKNFSNKGWFMLDKK